VRIIDVNGNIGVRPAELDRHSNRRFGVGDSANLQRDFLAAPLELMLELGNQRIGVARVELFERVSRGDSHTRGHEPNSENNEKCEQPK
jgi:hypothetical protein